MKNHELTFSKGNFITLKKERDMLKITLKCITEENDKLKEELNDMKITVKKNKDMLKEYITQITNKDKLFEKMSSTIEQLKTRLKALETSKREKETNSVSNYRLNDYSISNPNNHTTTASNNINSNFRSSDKNIVYNSLNSNIKNIIKGHGLKTDLNIKLSKTTMDFDGLKKGFNILNNKQKFLVKNKVELEKENLSNDIENNIENDNENNNDNKDINYFKEKQNYIMEEILNIKDDIQFIIENKNKSKMQSKLNQSIIFSNSLNSSFCSETNKNPNNNMNSSFSSENNHQQNSENSYISQNISNLSVSYHGTDQNIIRCLNYNMNIANLNNKDNSVNKKRKKFDLKERYIINENFSNFIDGINMKKEILFLIDGKENVWEIIRRSDLNVNLIRKYGNKKPNEIKSVLSLINKGNNRGILGLISRSNSNQENDNYSSGQKDMDFFNSKLMDIEIKDPSNSIFK